MESTVDRISQLKRNQVNRINSYLDGMGYPLFDSVQLRFLRYFNDSDVLNMRQCCTHIRGFFIKMKPELMINSHGELLENLVNEKVSMIESDEYSESEFKAEIQEIRDELKKTTASYILILETNASSSCECLLLNNYFFPLSIRTITQ